MQSLVPNLGLALVPLAGPATVLVAVAPAALGSKAGALRAARGFWAFVGSVTAGAFRVTSHIASNCSLQRTASPRAELV